MNSNEHKILRDKDVLGMDKPLNQLKPLKRKNNNLWFFLIALIIIMLGAVVTFYLKQ